MKYLITESQLVFILEGVPSWIKRRLDKENLSKYIFNSVIDFPSPCDEFKEDWHYANVVIRWATEELMLSDESYEWGDDYDEIFNEVFKVIESLYLPILTQKYREMCDKK